MDSSYIDLPGSEIDAIEQVDDRITIHFSRAFVIQSMTGAKESTRWHQSGSLIFEGAELEERPEATRLVCAGGDVGENVYTYRDMIPIPLVSNGSAHCLIRFRDTDATLRVMGTGVRVEMEDRPQYIEHIQDA